jgi:surface protein
MSCFQSTRELQGAIDDYLLDDSSQSYVALRYGYPMSSWCVSEITDFGRIFSSDRNPRCAEFNEDISSWDTCNVSSLAFTFAGAISFDQDLSSWNTSSVTNMHETFRDAHSFTGKGLENWKTRSVTSLEKSFANAYAFQGDLSSWDVGNVVNMESIFSNCTLFASDLSSWNTNSVTNFNAMFQNCSRFNCDLSGWSVENGIGFRRTFQGATSFNQDLSSWKLTTVLTTLKMFGGASSFRQNLCPWATYFESATVAVESLDMFHGTSCPLQQSPNVTSPFCFDCSLENHREITPSETSSDAFRQDFFSGNAGLLALAFSFFMFRSSMFGL